MSKERELITELYTHLTHSDVECRFDVNDVLRKAEDYLAQPEQEQELRVSGWLPFKKKEHGIGGEE
jgi:hypothetical protein